MDRSKLAVVAQSKKQESYFLGMLKYIVVVIIWRGFFFADSLKPSRNARKTP